MSNSSGEVILEDRGARLELKMVHRLQVHQTKFWTSSRSLTTLTEQGKSEFLLITPFRAENRFLLD